MTSNCRQGSVFLARKGRDENKVKIVYSKVFTTFLGCSPIAEIRVEIALGINIANTLTAEHSSLNGFRGR